MTAEFGAFIQEILADLVVKRLVTDSRQVQPGDTFVACPGDGFDGREFIEQAIEAGANAVIWEADNFVWNEAWKVPNRRVTDLRHKSGWLADALYGSPSKALWMIGVTGTNGKTSTCHWIGQALNEAGKTCALIGTLGNGFAGSLQASANTTPDAVKLQGLLADYRDAGAKAIAMEVSSHALVQGRVSGVAFDVALLTNLTRDHLDYHGDMKNYAAAKRSLFDSPELKYAVLNLDCDFGAELALTLAGRPVEVIAYGWTEGASRFAEREGLRMVRGYVRSMTASGMRLLLDTSWGKCELNSVLLGRFNAENLLGALAVLLVSDVNLNVATNSLSQVQPVSGRMQKIGAETNRQ